MGDILTLPESTIMPDERLDDGSDDTGDEFSHIVFKEDWELGYIHGKTVTALCGKKWKPSKDVGGLPVCGKCQIIAATR